MPETHIHENSNKRLKTNKFHSILFRLINIRQFVYNMCVCARGRNQQNERIGDGCARATAFFPLLKCVSMEKDELSSRSSASMWFE